MKLMTFKQNISGCDKLPNLFNRFFYGVVIALCLWGVSVRAADIIINIDKTADQSKLVAVSISGFTGEVLAAIKFDLEVVGFTNTTPEHAQFLISGSNTDHVEGSVTDRISKTSLVAKRFAGTSLRAQAHAFADVVVQTLRQIPGIAQTKIVYKSISGSSSELYLSDYDGYNSTALTADRSIVAAPAWAPGRRLLFFTSYRLGNPDIYSYNMDSGERKVVARYTGLNTSAAISPDGRRVAMILSKSGSPDLYVGNLDGTNLRQLTTTREDESSPCWSPDGSTICFSSRMSGRAKLYTIPANGGSMAILRTVGVLGNITEPDWSPDGKAIAFTTTVGGFTICTVPARGGNAEMLVQGEDPSWSPNSRTLMFCRRNGNKYVLSLLDVPTKRVKNITQISGSASQPAWAR